MVRSLCLSVLVGMLSWAAPAQANGFSDEVSFLVARGTGCGGTSYHGEIGVTAAAATAVQLWDANEAMWADFDYDSNDGQYWIESPGFASLAGLNGMLGGVTRLRLYDGADYATYGFTIATVAEGMFPVQPEITPEPFPASVPQDYTFTWTWAGSTGDVDELVVEAAIDSAGVFEEAQYTKGTIALAATSWTPGLPATGAGAEFMVGYGVFNDGIVGGWGYLGGESTTGDLLDFTGEAGLLRIVGSEDSVCGFEVVPEPASLGLLALGGLGLIRRRR